MDSRQSCLSQGEKLGVDDGKHGLAAAVAVSQRALQEVQQALRQQDGRQDLHTCTKTPTHTNGLCY